MLRIPSSVADLQNMIMANASVLIAFIAGVFAAPTVSTILDRIRG